MKIQTAFVLLSAVVAAGAWGCGSSDSQTQTGTTRASLHRAKGCGDLLSDLKADAKFKLNKVIDRQIQSIQTCLAKYGEEQCAYVGGGYDYGGGRGGAVGAPSAEAGAQDNGSTAPPAAPAKASEYSETNTQVAGVDEADIVKTDGSNLYVLHGRAFKVLKAWPANSLAELGTLDIEGSPSEMFVADGKVVVYSTVNGAKIFQAAGVAPKHQYQDWIYYGGGPGGPAVGAPEPAVDREGDVGAPAPPYVPLTKVTVLTLNGGTPAVAREVYFEGGYLDSRRVGQHVRTVLQGFAYGPKLKHSVYELLAPPPTKGETGTELPTNTTDDPYPKTGSAMIQALEQLRAANIAAIDASTLGEWLPYTFEKEGAAVSAKTIACEDFYVPTAGSTENGITEVASLDLADPAAVPRETAILGRADTVYGDADNLYLAAHAWVEPPFAWADPIGGSGDGDVAVSPPPESGTAEPAPAGDPGVGAQSVRPLADPAKPEPVVTAWATNKTHLHKFEFASDPKFPNYVASGTVIGNVKDQFSLDEKDGYLRVATTENRQYIDSEGRWTGALPNDPVTGVSPRPDTVNHVFVLGANGPWLDVVGSTKDLAPNERIYSVRFLGGRGYVVTFRQVDPLFVIDLNVPQSPQVLAALKIPGFSEYMHPLDETHLLTIGRDATNEGRVRGLQLQIFDVTDGANPVLQHKYTYTSDEYGHSEAEHDHKAFTYFAARNMLAFPYYAYNYSSGDGGMRSSLELFKVDVNTGFSKLGSIDHTALVQNNPGGYCGGYYRPSVRRGVFMENFVYSVSYGGVVVKDANNLAAQVSQLALSAPQTNEGYGPACY